MRAASGASAAALLALVCTAPAIATAQGVLLVDPAAWQPPPAADFLCQSDPTLAPSLAPVVRLGAGPGYASDHAPQPFAWALMTGAADWLGTGDAAAGRRTLDLLRRWAEGRALTDWEDQQPGTVFAAARTLFPALQAYALLRDAPFATAEDRSAIEPWLADLVSRVDEADPPDEALSARNNLRLLREAVAMAWALLSGDAARVESASDFWRLTVATQGADGHLPAEAVRGASAGWYTNQAIGTLVAMAEMAARNGRDLWSEAPEGRSIHDAIRYLLDGTADPARLAEYSAANLYAHPGHGSDPLAPDVTYADNYHRSRHYLAWTEIYLARFPDSPNVPRIRALLDRYQAYFPKISDIAGGNLSCLFGRQG